MLNSDTNFLGNTGSGSDLDPCVMYGIRIPKPVSSPALLVTGLWIRIHFLRIRIRIRIQWILMEANTDPDTDPDPDPIRIQGFNDQKLKKN